VVAFDGTVTEPGTVKAGDALLVSVTVSPLAGATLDNVTVHVVLPFDARVVAAQESVLMVGTEGAEPVPEPIPEPVPVMLAVPPVAESARGSPADDALTGLVIPIAALVEPGASITIAVATTPLGIVLLFCPATMQM
jgi:hypothetical protein